MQPEDCPDCGLDYTDLSSAPTKQRGRPLQYPLIPGESGYERSKRLQNERNARARATRVEKEDTPEILHVRQQIMYLENELAIARNTLTRLRHDQRVKRTT